MFTGPTFPFRTSLRFTGGFILIASTYSLLLSGAYYYLEWYWLAMPWKPISLIGTALAFYLGFKNGSAYDRLWEGRKIWGGIVNGSRSFAVMARDFVQDDEPEKAEAAETAETAETAERIVKSGRGDKSDKSDKDAAELRRELVHRHVAWLHVLALELRRLKPWEHQKPVNTQYRDFFGTTYKEENLVEVLNTYLSGSEVEYVLSKKNRSSHLLSQQSRRLRQLRNEGKLDHFRHLAMQRLITEFFTLQGKSERIKNFPLPRQYASGTFFFICVFVVMVPPAMLDVFSHALDPRTVFAAAPLTAVCLWVYWFMDIIGEYSENPFEGLVNDVPVTTMARGIEIDIRQMLDETDLPPPIKPVGDAGDVQV